VVDGEVEKTERPVHVDADTDEQLACQLNFSRGPDFFFPWASDWILRCETDSEHLDDPKPKSFCDGEWHFEQRLSKLTKRFLWWAYRECPLIYGERSATKGLK
jgi:hypothetical protein